MRNIIGSILILALGFVLISGIIDLNNLFNYTDQNIPKYILKSNIPQENQITNKGATLGRVLFYDKHLSIDNTISCASCHLQEFAFSDTALVSKGVNGVTGRHSMRLINAAYSDEVKFFWDERALSLEEQSTMPIQDHIEMGFSGENDDPGMDSLIIKMSKIHYYKMLFNFVYGNSTITENKIQKALGQFVRSIQSYDSKYDLGRVNVNSDLEDFHNFTDLENQGKNLFFLHPPRGGAGCNRCHIAPEFSIEPSSMNNGVTGVANKPDENDYIVSRAPSLRDLVKADGRSNGPFMHDGSLKTLMDVINHYNDLEEDITNINLDFRLAGRMHDLNLTDIEKNALVAFLKTLSGVMVYTEEKWSDPFDKNGHIELIPLLTRTIDKYRNVTPLTIYPNPTRDKINIHLIEGLYQVDIINSHGQVELSLINNGQEGINVQKLSQGIFVIRVLDLNKKTVYSSKLVIK